MNDFNTIIDLPISPEEIGVSLPPSQLRRIDFSALDFEALRRMGVEYVRTYFPEDFNDFTISNGFVLFLEIVSAVGNVISERSDIIADESFLPTAQSRTAVANHLELIGQMLRRASAATVEIECSLAVPAAFDVTIPAGLIFTVSGPDGSPVAYELYGAPGDFETDLVIPRGKRGVIGFAIEGRFASPITQISNGEPNQFVDIVGSNILESPITVEVASGSTATLWSRVDFIEQSDANDDVFEVRFLEDRARVIFGDDQNGKIPISGQVITVNHRTGGGIRGRIGSGIINETRPIGQTGFATQTVLFRNVEPSIGGQDQESLSSAKKRAPRTFAIHNNVATSEDYISISETFAHPAFGAIQKASAAIRTGIDNDVDDVVKAVRSAPTLEAAKTYLLGNYVNRNIVELYVLQEDENVPIAPNKGLKEALKTRIEDINVFTDEVRVLDGSIRPINISATVTVSRNVDATLVKEQVDLAIAGVFNINEIEMGESFNRSDLIRAISNVAGVAAVDLFEPADDFPSLGTIVDSSIPVEDRPQGIGINELFVLGSQNLQYFLERGNLNT